MTAGMLRCLMVALLACATFCGWAVAQTVDTRCIRDGGIAFCTEPVIVPSSPGAAVDWQMWTYNVCDMAGAYTYRQKAWCEAEGGTWSAGPVCAGARPIYDADIAPVSTTFERIVTNACTLDLADTGWGQSIPYNLLCWYGGPLVQNGVRVRDFRTLNFSGLAPSQTGCNAPWREVVQAGRWRALACPSGYNTRTRPNGDLECWRLPAECSTVANPINLLDGCKLQREADYRTRTLGGVELERFYNSAGYFRFDAAPQQATDVWRTTWDRRILAPPAVGNVLAYAQRADGSVQAFLPDGREMHNLRGGGSAVLQRLTDSAGATTGWRLTTADRDVEVYDAAGRVQSIALRTGHTFTLAYNANGRLATVTDIYGVSLGFTYDASGRLGGFVAPGNRTFAYGYDALGRLTTVTYPDSTVRTYHYEDPAFLHALTGITDENGQRFASWRYDGTGRATFSQHAGGAETYTLYPGSFSPTTNSGSTIAVDAFGTRRTYSYQIAGNVLRINRISRSCPGCSGGDLTYTYDANGNVATYRDFNGNQSSYTYDLTRNLEISRTEALGTALARTITTQWHPVYRLPTRITAPSGVAGVDEVTELTYDAQGNLLQKRLTAGATTRQWTRTYNVRSQVRTIDGPRADVADIVQYSYYGPPNACVACRGNMFTMGNALGHVTTFDTYDVDGQPTRITDPNGVVTALTYDLRGRLRTRTIHAGSPAAETTSFDYDNVGQLIRVTLPDASFLRYQYDAAHRLTEVADGLGNVIQYTLDAMGNRIKEDLYAPNDQLMKTQRRVYDALNRLYNDIGAAGQTSVYLYDGNGNLTRSTDPLNRSTIQSYDALNRRSSTTDPAGGVARFGYDAKDRLISVRDPINLATEYRYDGFGNLTQLSSQDTGVATHVPDAAGNVIGSTDARGMATSYTYDALDRQTLASFVGGSVALEYDNTATGGAYAKGRLTRVTDPSGSTSYSYDAWGRVLSKRQTVGTDASAKSFTVGYQYAAGRMTGITYPSGRSVSYAFDAQGRVSGVTVAGQAVLSDVVYFPFGVARRWTLANGQLYRRRLDTDGRVAALSLGPDTTTYGNEAWMFGYDALNRLTTATLPQGATLGYAYDGNGNRRQETRTGAITNYTYSASSNRLQALSGSAAKSFAYDAAGNLTSNGSVTLTYDGRGRLTQSSSGHRYLVNGLGQRVAKSGPGVASGMNYFAYDEQGHLIGEYDASGAVRQELLYLGDTPVASVRTAAGGGVDIYPIYTDHLNTPRLITNQANQKVWEWPLDTFGATAANENPSGLGVFSFNLRFPGQYYDAETGLHYNYFRDYDPSVGRYVQSDPIGLEAGINTYAYALGNPVARRDFFGLDTCGSGILEGLVPDNPFLFPFSSCCRNHDNCYDNCWSMPTKTDCDDRFCGCMKSRCQRYGYVRGFCEWTAQKYCDAVASKGQPAFDGARKKCNGASCPRQ